MTQKVELKINPAHDPEELAKTLLDNGRLQVSHFFSDETANYLHKLLITHQHWYLAYNDGNQFFESPVSELQALDPEKRQRFMNSIYARAQRQFQYAFFQYYITQAIELNEQPGHPMHQMHHFMNSDEMLAFMRILTNEPNVSKADSYASNYSPGHFLTDHNDTHTKHDRVAAYVFSMTKNWDVNWGGHLAFYDDLGNVKEAFIPSFNTLNIFLIPQRHAVQQVAPYAGGSRTSFLGWLQR